MPYLQAGGSASPPCGPRRICLEAVQLGKGGNDCDWCATRNMHNSILKKHFQNLPPCAQTPAAIKFVCHIPATMSAARLSS